MSSGPHNLAARKINDYPRAKATFHESVLAREKLLFAGRYISDEPAK